MSERIEFYREILELDPSSRVFFLFAQLLVKEGMTDEALRVLEQGLAHQPDYLEARLYYIDLLSKENKVSYAFSELDKFTEVLKKYPGFWNVWSHASEKSPDVSASLGLLSALFANPSLSLIDVLQAGIRVYSDASFTLPQENKFFEQSADSKKTESIERAYKSPTFDDIATIVEESNTESFSLPFDIYKGNGSEKFSTRTRSMAELLAEQGDLEGAIDIYTELYNKASQYGQGWDKEDIEARLNLLQARLAGNGKEGEIKLENETTLDYNTSLPAVDETEQTKDSGILSKRMQNMLEKLAERLESRANA